MLIGSDVVIKEIEEPRDAGERDDDGGAGGRSLLGNFEVTAARVLLEIEIKELVLHLQSLTD